MKTLCKLPALALLALTLATGCGGKDQTYGEGHNQVGTDTARIQPIDDEDAPSGDTTSASAPIRSEEYAPAPEHKAVPGGDTIKD